MIVNYNHKTFIVQATDLASLYMNAYAPRFSTLSLVVFVMSATAWHMQARPCLELKIGSSFVLLF
jgi:hypothetical protein